MFVPSTLSSCFPNYTSKPPTISRYELVKQIHYHFSFLVSLSSCVILNPAAACAATSSTQVIEAIDSGFYLRVGDKYDHLPSNRNFLVGNPTAPVNAEYRNFFVFDLSEVTGPLLSARFEAFVEPGSAGVTLPSPSRIDTWTLFDVVSGVGPLVSEATPEQTFADLASGQVYGSVDFSQASAGTLLTVPLNQTAIDAIESTSGLWAFGGAITTLIPDVKQHLFGNSGVHSMPRLVITTVPEPTTLSLFSMACIACYTIRRGRQL